ncbi:hypothetical protein [Acuticoccus kandeliae]|uniref:hypothetical protein n=1 Tax=Acuticoccus kandeliae TaxID=2073160 RepID=UPI000D3EABC8|nr:hypothetical protein [Acuticoccus kandeliae]
MMNDLDGGLTGAPGSIHDTPVAARLADDFATQLSFVFTDPPRPTPMAAASRTPGRIIDYRTAVGRIRACAANDPLPALAQAAIPPLLGMSADRRLAPAEAVISAYGNVIYLAGRPLVPHHCPVAPDRRFVNDALEAARRARRMQSPLAEERSPSGDATFSRKHAIAPGLTPVAWLNRIIARATLEPAG